MSQRPALILAISTTVMLSPCLSAPASAQVTYRDEPQTYYRDGQPAVQTPPPPRADPADGIRNRFRSAYVRAKSPRVVVFWNREFTDEVGTNYDVVARSRSEAHVGYDSATVESESRLGVERTTDNTRWSGMSEAGDFDAENGFQSALSRAGVNLIDRTSIMRTSGAAKKVGATGNIQELETEAVLGRADIIVEVTQIWSGAADGKSFKIVARDIRRAKVLASFRTSAVPPKGPTRYVAGAHGFEVAQEPAPSASRMGEQAATDLMARLTGSL
jgi:hypothetical protein